MIKINLLPPSERPRHRTPLPRLFLIFLCVALAGGTVASIFYLSVEIKGLNGELQAKRQQLAQLSGQIQNYDALDRQLRTEAAEVRDISKVVGRPIEWWQALDAVWDVLNKPEHAEVWLEEIKVLDGEAVKRLIRQNDPRARVFPPFGLEIKGAVGGDDPQEITSFRMDLKKHPLLAQVLPGMNLDPSFRTRAERDYVVSRSLQFTVILLGAAQRRGAVRR